MIKIFLTADPETGRGLYDDESQFLGKYASIYEAEQELGDLLRFCSIHSDIPHALAG